MERVRKVQVAVIGGGTAGAVAAIAAARNNAEVLLIEKAGFVGGTTSMALAISLSKLCDRAGRQVIGGITREILGRAADMSSAQNVATDTGICEPKNIGYVMLQMLEEADVKLLLHSISFDVLMEGNNVCGVVIANKSGKEYVIADIVIDATGDADIAVAAGAGYNVGRVSDQRTQAIGIPFVIGNVDVEALRQDDPELFVLTNQLLKPESLLLTQKTPRIWQQKQEEENLPEFHSFMVPFLQIPGRQGEVYVVVSLPLDYSGIDAEHLTEAEVEAKRVERRVLKFLQDNVPGFGSSFLLQTSHQVGVRETRRIIGEYILTAEDIQDSRRFNDVVCRLPYPVGWDHIVEEGSDLSRDHHFRNYPREGTYDIPLRCLIPKGVNNLLVAGRCISISHEALTSIRIIPGCMALGEAAGTAAALAIKERVAPEDVPIRDLQELLRL